MLVSFSLMSPRSLWPLLLAVCGGAALAQAPGELIPWRASLDPGAGVLTQVLTPEAAGAGGLVLQGTVVLPAQQSDVVSLPVAGVVQAVLVSPMQTVRAGQAVARIMSPELVAWQREWLHAETLAKQAAGKAQRDEQMFAEGIISEHRRNESRAQHEMAALSARERRQSLRLAGLSEAALAQAAASASLSPQLTLVAPVAGTVLEQAVLPGQRLEAGSPVLQIARAGRLAIELQASAQQAQALRVGDSLQVNGCQKPVRIVAISNQLNAPTQGVQLRAEPAAHEACLRINQFVQARWLGTAGRTGDAALRVPAAAVVQHGGQNYVFVRVAQGFRAVPVKTGPVGGADMPVVSGLKAGDVVAVKGLAAIKGAWLGLGEEAAAPAAGK